MRRDDRVFLAPDDQLPARRADARRGLSHDTDPCSGDRRKRSTRALKASKLICARSAGSGYFPRTAQRRTDAGILRRVVHPSSTLLEVIRRGAQRHPRARSHQVLQRTSVIGTMGCEPRPSWRAASLQLRHQRFAREASMAAPVHVESVIRRADQERPLSHRTPVRHDGCSCAAARPCKRSCEARLERSRVVASTRTAQVSPA